MRAMTIGPDYEPPIPDDVRHAAMRWNAPLSGAHASILLDALQPEDATSVLDLGCGWGEMLMRAVQRGSALTGTGVDSDATAILRGRGLAAERGLGERVRLVEAPADSWAEPSPRVICVGAKHIWDDTEAALAALWELTAPGGRLLYGDGFLEAEPSPFTAELFTEMGSLPELLEATRAPGWRVLHLSVSDQLEWDEFESSYRAGTERWLLADPGAEDVSGIREWLDGRLTEYLDGYRGELGFAWLVLGRSS
jgi:SAM-dependent methyltransferase